MSGRLLFKTGNRSRKFKLSADDPATCEVGLNVILVFLPYLARVLVKHRETALQSLPKMAQKQEGDLDEQLNLQPFAESNWLSSASPYSRNLRAPTQVLLILLSNLVITPTPITLSEDMFVRSSKLRYSLMC